MSDGVFDVATLTLTLTLALTLTLTLTLACMATHQGMFDFGPEKTPSAPAVVVHASWPSGRAPGLITRVLRCAAGTTHWHTNDVYCSVPVAPTVAPRCGIGVVGPRTKGPHAHACSRGGGHTSGTLQLEV
eukprot:scaffold111826_cov58-Phaeocystis_antarctica.AAC.6